MVKTNSRAYIPVARVKGVLDKCGLLSVHRLGGELEPYRRAGIELRRIGNGVLERLVNRIEDAVRADLDVVMTVMPGEIGARIAFPKASLLGNEDRSRIGIRPKPGGVVAHTALGIEQQRWRDHALVIDQPASLLVISILALPGILLHQFIGDFEVHAALAYSYADAVPIRKIP